MRARIHAMRTALFEAGKAEGVDMSFAVKQKGMFSFTGLAPEEMDVLLKSMPSTAFATAASALRV